MNGYSSMFNRPFTKKTRQQYAYVKEIYEKLIGCYANNVRKTLIRYHYAV